MGLQERCLSRVRTVMHTVSGLNVTFLRKTVRTFPVLRNALWYHTTPKIQFNRVTLTSYKRTLRTCTYVPGNS
jgi:hypothetical protein